MSLKDAADAARAAEVAQDRIKGLQAELTTVQERAEVLRTALNNERSNLARATARLKEAAAEIK
jgi:predicted  nucleic acid-binding Zn-ribbon protein